MKRMDYLRAIIVESDGFMDQAIEVIADVKAWIIVHCAMTDLGNTSAFMVQVEAQHRRASRTIELMRLVHKRCTFTSLEAMKELKRHPSAGIEIIELARQLRIAALRSGRLSDAIGKVFEEDFVGMTQHVVKLTYHAVGALPAPLEPPIA